MIPDIIINLIQWLATIVGIIGVTVITIGAFTAIIRYFVGIFSKHISGEKIARRHIDPIRVEFGRYITFGLEFLIARDLLDTIFTSGWSRLGELLLLVIIRTIISYFLLYEIQKLEEQGVSLKNHKA